MSQGKLVLSTKSNTEGRVTVRRRLPEGSYRREPQENQGRKDEPNPRYREDFERVLKGNS